MGQALYFKFEDASPFILESMDMEKKSTGVELPTSQLRVSVSTDAKYRRFADENFASLNYSAAMKYYLESIRLGEPHVAYSYLNGANLAAELNNIDLAAEWIKLAYLESDLDQKYAATVFGQVLSKICIRNRSVFQDLAEQIGYVRTPVDYGDFFCLVLGFPRCGTTAITSSLKKQYGLEGGLTAESFLSIEDMVTPEDLWRRLFLLRSYSPPSNFAGRPKLIEKSTLFCLSREILIDIKNKFPHSKIVLCVREPFERSVSAYLSCANHLKYSFEDAVRIEIEIIRAIGGVGLIYSQMLYLSRYIDGMAASGLNHPIVYPTVLMMNLEALICDVDFGSMTIFDISKRESRGDSIEIDFTWATVENSSKGDIDGSLAGLRERFFLLIRELVGSVVMFGYL